MISSVGIKPATILLPKATVDPEKWACVACDQYTSQPEYWQQVASYVGDDPSTLHLMLPECFLSDSKAMIPQIHTRMKKDLADGILTEAVSSGYILCERRLSGGTRTGLICTVDLEAYDYTPGSLSLVRPTEQTITSRLPPRLEIRRGASIELTHIMILIDDPDDLILSPLKKKKATLKKLYDFELMMNGGHLSGYAVEQQEDLDAITQRMEKLKQSLGENPMLLAVGDGNHSLATAKAYWEEIRQNLSVEEAAVHPARFALCEIVNIHDSALLFEPIHRILKNIHPSQLLSFWNSYAAARHMVLSEAPNAKGHRFTVLFGTQKYFLTVENPDGVIPCETIQHFLDAYLKEHHETEIDYIHGADSLRTLSALEGNIGFLLPEIDKNHFFADVKKLGVLPRKTFSMGEANEKRYYMECKKI